MTHPFFRNYISQIFYSGVWVLIGIIHTLVLYFPVGLEFETSFVDATVFNFLFALMILPIWYVILYNKEERRIVGKFAVSALVFLLVWLLVGFLLMKILFWNNSTYQNFLLQSLPWRFVVGLFLFSFFMLVYYVSLYAVKLREQTDNEIKLLETLKDSELNVLKSQINPHFLFNGLNSINSLILHSPQKAQAMLLSLSDYLRYTALTTHQQFASLHDEIENAKRYLDIEKVRFGDKFSYTFDYMPDCLALKVPAMILQPIFENSIKHGVCESIKPVNITAVFEQKGYFLHIQICNDFDMENRSIKSRSGIGLKNISSRLQLLYKQEAILQTKILEDGRFCVNIQIPLIDTKLK